MHDAKRASLAADEHLARWLHRSAQGHRELQAIATGSRGRATSTSMAVARTLYLRLFLQRVNLSASEVRLKLRAERPDIEPRGGKVEDPIADFYRDSYQGLLGWMAVRSPGAADLEDAVQEAIVRAWLQPPGEIESLDGWLRAVALNCARSDLRRRDAEARALGRLGIPAGSADGQEDVVGRLAWAEALDHLSGGQRRAVALHYFEDRSVEDVAAELGVSTGTVRASCIGPEPGWPGFSDAQRTSPARRR